MVMDKKEVMGTPNKIAWSEIGLSGRMHIEQRKHKHVQYHLKISPPRVGHEPRTEDVRGERVSKA
jgi:hypothetical protein